jgi:hypothetical protein
MYLKETGCKFVDRIQKDQERDSPTGNCKHNNKPLASTKGKEYPD